MSDDRTAIVELLAEFAAATDTRDWETIASLLTDDCVAYGARGPEAVVRRMQDHLGGVGPTQHLLGDHRVSVAEHEARSLTYGRVHHQGAGPMSGSFFECMGDYDDRWVRTDAGWRIARRWFEIRISLGDVAVLRPA
ncbi:nuclear transport factor 2 family protein [Nocardioides sp. YIM 152315]|uniref:nuclear transport factor 2 family protein n=1 Tax=Nocardioides sp. YIM 152315 TaxID=3031760 RepID=UPI0023D9C8B7|nr:nuclear transport factor 2 family protein [Nocardioides sp. YIM 152315]MDF1604101.1 nuclear transport factor 2 family protein [Nocardioides sp. YIM 152315]